MVSEEELNELISDNPTLYHMAELGSWESIRTHGLLGTSSLLDLFEISGPSREKIESFRRPESVRISREGIGSAVIRDQKPMDDSGLIRCLQDGLKPRDWYETLNARVFFWLTKSRLIRLLRAKPYINTEHDVLEIDTASLVEIYREQITLAPINTGATKPMPAPRGKSTILGIKEYPYSARKLSHKREPVVELAVLTGVPNISDFVKRVIRMKGDIELKEIWKRP